MTQLVVIEVNGENRMDSRLIAQNLGIEIRAFHQTLNKYQQELKELGSLTFEMDVKTSKKGNRGGELPKFTMLNEDQSIFAATLSRNTKEVVAFKLQLTKAFAEARARLAQPASGHFINSDFMQRLKLNASKVPYNYFTVLEQLARDALYCHLAEQELAPNARPDGSIGQMWAGYLRKSGYDTTGVIEIDNVVNIRYGKVRPVKAYPLDMLPMFRRWLHEVNTEHFEGYLPGRSQRKELKG